MIVGHTKESYLMSLSAPQVRALADGMPYRHESTKSEIIAWLLKYHRDAVTRAMSEASSTDDPTTDRRTDVPDTATETTKISDLQPNLLMQTHARELLKISTIYDTRVTAQVLYPMPPRTTVREYTEAEVATWHEPSDQLIARYETAWGLR